MRRFLGFSAALILLGCGGASNRNARDADRVDPDSGRTKIAEYGCGACHTIPGIPGAHGQVGPPLAGIAQRQYVAGLLPNDASNLQKWIENPHSVNPNTLMPNLGVTPQDASSISMYLYTLR
ncbi:MAG: c-type cytochrome [Bryobacterales bacterium]|nr:c-type cytochrome [Bryobacterales bacterium]